MATFSARDADNILKNLNATTQRAGGHIVGIVHVTDNHRVRLMRSRQTGDQPSFVFNKWKQTLRLSNEEMRDCAQGRLKGEAALQLIRNRLGLSDG